MKSYSSFELAKILKAHGWYFYKANGSHHHYKHPTKMVKSLSLILEKIYPIKQ